MNRSLYDRSEYLPTGTLTRRSCQGNPHHVKYPHSLPSKISSILPVQLTSMFLGYPYHKAHSICITLFIIYHDIHHISRYSLYITIFIVYHNIHHMSYMFITLVHLIIWITSFMINLIK
jgi:hypothetical protein